MILEHNICHLNPFSKYRTLTFYALMWPRTNWMALCLLFMIKQTDQTLENILLSVSINGLSSDIYNCNLNEIDYFTFLWPQAQLFIRVQRQVTSTEHQPLTEPI